MRRASVPVVGYLSFLASNSDIANDFIALEDHLDFIKENYQENKDNGTRNEVE